MWSIFGKIKEWITNNQKDIILVAGVILISLLSFAAGYILRAEQSKQPIQIEDNNASCNVSS